MNQPPVVFISYNSASSTVAADLAEQLSDIAIVKRYETDVRISGSFEEFMNSITSADFIISIISVAYLRSDACMFEGIKATESNRLVYYIVENDAVPIVYNRDARLDVVEYWSNEAQRFSDRVERLPVSARDGLRPGLSRLRFVRDNAALFLNKLQDTRNTSSYRVVMEIKQTIKQMRFDSKEQDMRNNILSVIYDHIPDQEKIVYNANKDGSISRADLEPLIGKNKRETLVILNSMIDSGVLVRTGGGSKVKYMIADGILSAG